MRNSTRVPQRLLRAALLAPMLLAGVPHSARATWPDPANGRNLPVSTAISYQQSPTACPDGAGGMIVVWNDARTLANNYDIYAQRVDASARARWTADGVPVCAVANSQNLPRIVEDGLGGAFITWYDARTTANAEDVYAQHVDANGNMLWTANGIAVCALAGTQINPRIVPDGAGGMFIVWRDGRSGLSQAYGQHLNSAGTALWTAGGLLLSPASTSGLDNIDVAADGVGGLCLAWRDFRGTPSNIVKRHVNGSGSATWGFAELSRLNPQDEPPVVASDGHGGTYCGFSLGTSIMVDYVSGDAAWSFSNIVSGSGTTYAGLTSIAPDGLGGAIVSWFGGTNFRYAQRLNLAGETQWGLGAPIVCSIYSYAVGQPATIVPDGIGGGTICGLTYSGAYGGISATHVSRIGSMTWPRGEVALQIGLASPDRLTATTDGAGGVIAAWDEFNNFSYDILAQRVDAFGYMGAEPQIVRVRDIRNDQGGFVELQWNATRLDVPGEAVVSDYSIWRQVPVLAAQSALARGARVLAAGEPRPASGAPMLRATGTVLAPIYWEYLGQQPARGFGAYSYVAPTASDSVPGSNPLTKFMVEAEQNPPTLYWNSAPDSGYSVDNLPPGPPAPIAIAYSLGASHLHWSPVAAPDLAGYRVYRGTSSSFTPAAANLVASPADTGYADAAGTLASWYKLSAVDIHGNESAFVTAQPWAPADVLPQLPRTLALRGTFPNPARDGATLHYALPEAAHVDLAILDLAGRRVRVLAAGARPAGEQAAAWDGRDESGRRAAPGLYFVRLEVGNRVLRSRFTVLD